MKKWLIALALLIAAPVAYSQVGGGVTSPVPVISDATITTTDITTNDASTAKHGFLKKLSNVATQYMDGTGNWSTPSATGTAYLCVTWTGGGTTVTRNVGYTATITRTGVGDYTVNSGTALPTAAVWTYGQYSAGNTSIIMFAGSAAPTTTTVRFISSTLAGAVADATTYWACAF